MLAAKSQPVKLGQVKKKNPQSMQVRAVNASQARLLEPSLLWWGSLALRIKAPQTVLFQDEPQSTTSSLEGKGGSSQG
jgi:hypothetical protein